MPQGSILGPLLFILYINDLPGVSNLANYIFFADDANIIITGYNYSEISTRVKTVLSAIDKWVTLNGLKLNIKKTKYMVFSNKRDNNTDKFNITLNGVSIEHSDRERFLGVILDSNLAWNSHLSGLASKISRNAGILYKLKGLVPVSVLRLVYNSLIQSHLYYCSNVWGLGSKSSIDRLFSSQKKAVRAIGNNFNNCFYNPDTGELPCHTKNSFSRDSLLTVHNIIAKNCLNAMHKIYLNTAPYRISRLVDANKEPDYTSRRDPVYFEISRSRLKALDKTFPFKGPILYNKVINLINKKHNFEFKLEQKFLNPFKTTVSRYLTEVQGAGGEEWALDNFILYNN